MLQRWADYLKTVKMLRISKMRVLIALLVVVCVKVFFVHFYPELISKNKLIGMIDYKHSALRRLFNKRFDVIRSTPNYRPDVGITDCSPCILGNISQYDHGQLEYYTFFTNKYSLGNSSVTAPFIDEHNTKSYCHGNAVIFNDVFAILHDVTLYPTRRFNMAAQSKGGEEIRDVIGQTLKQEEYTFHSDFFVIDCDEHMPSFESNTKMTLTKSMTFNVTKNRSSRHGRFSDVSGKYTILIRRQDYANLHNWVRNIYNTFITMMHFNLQPVNISIIFMDGHPAAEIDKAWGIMYGQPQRVGRLEQPVKYHNLILGLEENEGPVSDFRNTEVPFLEEFRSFVLSRFGLNSDVQLNCKQLRITIILRRNAVYHPRNAEGKVGRKIFNEAELTDALMRMYPRACVKALLMESLPMRAQLNVIRQTDILIGMHGAGMSHSMFLPKHAGILELFSRNFKQGRPWYRCFQAIASWRNLSYETWENFNSSLEMPHDFTIVPVDIVLDKTKVLVKHLCPNFEE